MSSWRRVGRRVGLIVAVVLVASLAIGCGVSATPATPAATAVLSLPTDLPPSATASPATEAQVSPTPAAPTATAVSAPSATETVAATPAPAAGRPFAWLRFVTVSTGWAMRAGPGGDGALTLWRTTDGGASWAGVSPPDGALRADAALDGSTAWVAALHADGTVMIYRTIDGGATWASARLGPAEVGQKDPSQPMWLSFVDARHGWLAIHGGLMMGGVAALFATADGGATWTRLRTNVGVASGLLGFQSAPVGWATGARAGGALAATTAADQQHPGLLFATRDGGRSWQYQPLPVPPGEAPSDIVQPAGPPQFSSGGVGIFPVFLQPTAARHAMAIEVYATRDGGRTWTTTPPFSLGTGATDEAADFVGTSDGWVVASGGLAATTDGGQHWTTLASAGFPTDNGVDTVRQLEFVDPDVGWALVGARSDPNATAVLRTADGGRSWTVVARTGDFLFPTVHEYQALAFGDAGHGCVAAGDGVLCTADGGRTWRAGAAGGASVVGLQFVTATTGWAVAVDRPTATPTPSDVAVAPAVPDLVLGTTDGGLHWQPVAHLAGLRSVSFADPARGWAVTDAGLLATGDGGRTWTRLAPPVGFDVAARAVGRGPPPRLADLVAPGVGWVVGDGGRVVGTRDGGATWTPAWTPPFGGSWANGPAVIRFAGPASGWLLLAQGQGCASQEGYALYHTTDGAHWALRFVGEGGCARPGEPNYPTTFPSRGVGGFAEDLATYGPDHAWLAEYSPASAQLVIHRTDDGGQNWSTVASISGDVDLVALRFVSDTEGWLITRGPTVSAANDRLLHTTDGGATWLPVTPAA